MVLASIAQATEAFDPSLELTPLYRLDFGGNLLVIKALGLGLSFRVVASNNISKLREKPNKKTRIAV